MIAGKLKSVVGITWKSQLIYNADAWLNIIFSGARVLLSFLLWQMIFTGKDVIGGYTFPMMVTYAIFSSQLAQLHHREDHAWQLAEEVLSGQFSKYLTHPFAITGHFYGVWLGIWLHQLVLIVITIAMWSLIFWNSISIELNTELLWMLLLLPLGGTVMMLFHHTIALMSLRFKDIGGFMMLKRSFVEFFSGAMIPLILMPDWLQGILKYTPFYYVIFYPVNLLLGQESQPPWIAILMLIFWCGVFYTAAQYWIKNAHQFYEGAGI